MNRPAHYTRARLALAEMLAIERDEVVSTSHLNEAASILWPYLSQDTQSRLVLR
jgi:hypothetical protein